MKTCYHKQCKTGKVLVPQKWLYKPNLMGYRQYVKAHPGTGTNLINSYTDSLILQHRRDNWWWQMLLNTHLVHIILGYLSHYKQNLHDRTEPSLVVDKWQVDIFEFQLSSFTTCKKQYNCFTKSTDRFKWSY